MADELTIRCTLSYTKDGYTVSKSHGPADHDVTGDNPVVNVQDVGTTEEALLLGDAGVGGILWARNLDATNFIEIRAGAGLADLVRLEPGDPPCMFRITDDATPYVIADTAACKLEYCVIPA